MTNLSLRQHVLLCCLAVLALFSTTASVQAQNAQVLDEIVAVVGDEIVLRSEVDGLVTGLIQQQQVPYSDDLWHEVLEQMIDEKVITIHAQRDTNIVVTDDQVEQGLTDRIRQMTQQVGSEAALEEVYGQSIVEIKADFRDDFRNQIMAEQLRSGKLYTIRITPSEVQTFFEQFPTDSLPTLPDIVRVSHIVRFPVVSEAARKEAREIITTIRDSVATGGATLEQMAELFSEDPGSASKGGRYTNSRLGDLVPEFASMAGRLPIGELSQIFETQFGLHILRVNNRRGDVVDYNHILIGFDERKFNPEPAIAHLTAVRDSALTQNIPFGLLARRNSEEQASAQQGGRVVDPRTGERDLYIEALGPQWKLTLANLEVGEISEPTPVDLLDGRKAHHIVLLHKRVPSHKVNIETDYALIEQFALRDKQARVLRKWVDGLREEVYIERRGKALEDTVAEN